ncbi:MAG: insulinase family protein [Acidobacteria bacterium]|nr:insulinase family protein [Acidobacteriota bacterium]
MKANKFFRRAALFSVALLMTASMASISKGQETPPAPAAPRSVTIPKPVEKTLRNGLRVIVVENANMPLVTSALMIKSGGEVDPANLSGLADMTADLLTKGTKTRTAPEIAQQVEALGGELNSGASWDSSIVTVNVMSSKIGQVLPILADVVRNPTFKDEEIERLRQQNLDNLEQAMHNPGSVASYVTARVVFGDEAYGHPLSGTPEATRAIKREDIVALHGKYYRPDNAILVFAGDIKAADAFKLAERLFGDWAKPAGALPATEMKSAENMSGGPRVVVVDMPQAGQAAVVVARRGLMRTDPEYFRGIVANSVLGGGYSARLNQEIRIKRGLSYGASSSLSARRNIGPFIASTQTKNESGAEVASLLMSELTRLASEPIADTELTPRKAVLTGNFGRNLETTGGLATQVANLALYGLSLDEINNYIKNVQAVSAGDVQRFAGSRIDQKGANLIIVGNSKLFIEDLRKQFPNVEVISIDDLDLNSASLRKNVSGKK